MALRILFLDDDPVIRVLRLVLSDAEHDPWIRDYFAPEKVDPSRLVKAAKGDNRPKKEAWMAARTNDIGITSNYYAMNARFCDMGEAEAH